MKKIRVYEITKEQYEKTEYRPLDVMTEEIETEDDWNYGDIVENCGNGTTAEIVVNARDLMVWKCENVYNKQYIVELKD